MASRERAKYFFEKKQAHKRLLEQVARQKEADKHETQTDIDTDTQED